ncbi:MAG: primosomal protein N' [Planctomycetia bacterium]|nr:primosomal protein N' [Planctomycetia bacterium]
MQQDLFVAPQPTTEAPTLFAEVVFDRPLDHAFTYGVPTDLAPLVAVGKRLKVPFGRGDRGIVGFCVGVTTTVPERKVKPILEVLDDDALLTDPLLRLTRWMADYYLCAWGQVLNAVVPAGARQQAGSIRRVFVEPVPDIEMPPKLSPRQTAALVALREVGKPVEVRLLLRKVGCGAGIVKALLERGLIRRVVRRVDRETQAPDDCEITGPLTLNDEQAHVVETLRPALHRGGFKPFLLYGVTGSGKTEVYLRAIEEVVARGKQALVLVPEISLTPQTVRRFAGRFGDVAVLHSHLGDAERGVHWRRVQTGQARVVVGARSAVFAPTRELGLIVIDEEHETSFKQDSTPRYQGRDVAVMRARIEDVPIVLGSATPSLESWHNAQRGAYTLLSLPRRVASRPLPPVRLLDMRHMPVRRGRPSALSDPLLESMRKALSQGGQVMLLLNRRGFATHVHCPACGHVESCRFCDLALTYHKQRDTMVCHYCSFEQEPAQNCPACGRSAIRYQGLGTEKLEAELQELFPAQVVRRMDSDTMRKPGSHARTLAAFRRGEIHILLGTQMIAKGLDFPNVTLVGVINADMGLHIPDFRSGERTFQLLSQVSGRAGRGPRGGCVYVQTFNPEHPAIRLAATHDYALFVAEELEHRREHAYPPYQRLARIIVRGMDEEAARQFSETLANAFTETIARFPLTEPAAVRLLGPAETPVFRLQGYYRFHFQLQSPSPATLHKVLRLVMPMHTPPKDIEVSLDVDPFNMM